MRSFAECVVGVVFSMRYLYVLTYTLSRTGSLDC